MALITCPECKNSVSDQAASCPRCGYPLTASRAPSSPQAPASASGNPFTQLMAVTVGLYLVALPVAIIMLVFVLGIVEGKGGPDLLHSSFFFSKGYWVSALLSALPLALLLTSPLRLFAGRIQPFNVLLTIAVDSFLIYFLLYLDIGVMLRLFNMGTTHPIGFWMMLILWLLTLVGSGYNYYSERKSDDPNDMAGIFIMFGNLGLYIVSVGTIVITLFTEIIISRNHAEGAMPSSMLTTVLVVALSPWLTSLAMSGFLRFAAKKRWNLVDQRLQTEHPENQEIFSKTIRELFGKS